jgi:ABC-type Fe3+ transport system substrate-binding protein
MNRTSRRSKLLLITGFLTAGAVALAGCSSTKASSSASTKPSKVTLVVYSAQGYDHAMTAAFTKATGIPGKLDDNSTGLLLTHPTNGPTLQALTSGQIKLALVQSSAGIGAEMTDASLKVSYLDPITLLPSAIGIDAKASKAEQTEAEKFVKYVLSKKGQQVMQSGDPSGDSLYYPLINGVQPLPALPSLGQVKVQTINPYTWGPRESSINTWFDSNIVQ